MPVRVDTAEAPAAIGPYSQAIKANGFLFVSGQIPIDPKGGTIVATDISGQTRQVMANLSAILEAEGLGFEDVVKTTIFLVDLADFARINDIYGSFFNTNPPARSTLQVSALPKGAKIEVEAVVALR